MRELIAMALLLIPIGYELLDDRKGDKNHGFYVFVRIGLVLLVSIYPWYIGHGYGASIAMAVGLFTMFFDYLEHAINLRRADWFSFIGTTSKVDRMKIWKELSAWGRFAIRAVVFITALGLYILSARH